MSFLIALAAQMSAAEPKYMWFSNDDTPVQEIAGRDFVRVRLRLTIPSDGRVHACEIEQSSGNPRIDLYTCELTRKRALFRPARSPAGDVTYGVYRVPVVWATKPLDLLPSGDLSVPVKELPKGVHPPISVRLMFAVDNAGQISSCDGEPPWSSGIRPNNPALVSIACDQLLRSWKAAPAKDEKGRSVSSVQNATVVITKG